MTFPGGAPGGYPGQGPQQQPPFPGPGYGPPPAGGGTKLGLPTILHLATAGASLVNFFVGFADAYDGGDSGFFANLGVLPTLFLIGGLFALPAILPGEDKKPGIAPLVFSLASWLTILFFTFSTEPDVGTGTILLMIFGFVQTGAAAAAFLFDAGILKPPAPNPYGQQPGGQFPPSGQFPAPPPQQPQPPQPGQFGAPPGQQTTFAPQQGQFGQPPQQPGTPPGGYPQQH